MKTQCCIVGGGPAGMMLGFLLARAGVEVIESKGRFDRGSILVMLDRGDYWQCAYVIAKGSAERLKQAGESLVRLMPFLADRAVRATQAIQVLLQNRMIAPTLAGTRPLRPVRRMNRVLQRLPARVLGLGVQPEHVKTKS